MTTNSSSKRKRKRGCEMTIKELQQFEFLNGVQAARYCGMSPRTFYHYLGLTDMPKYVRPTKSVKGKVLYRRTDLDEKLRPRTLMQKVEFIQIQEQNKSLTAKKGKALDSPSNAATVLQRASR